MRRSRGSRRAVCRRPGCDGARAPHGWYRTKRGRRRRWRCRACGATFSSTTGTAYEGIQATRREFDAVVSMSVEGITVSAIARITGRSWNTVDRWLRRACRVAARFLGRRLRGFGLVEVQADEIRSFVGSKKRPTWVFASMEVWSRLWMGAQVGARSKRNTKALLRDLARRSKHAIGVLVATDGFRYYEPAIRQALPAGVVYGQVIKSRRKERVVRVERRLIIGSDWGLEQALAESEDSERLNTSFIERLNLTIRAGCSYLGRRTIAHARIVDRLAGQLDLLRCHYNFVRPHRALRFGQVTRTPAMQAGLAPRALSWREIFGSAVPGRWGGGTVVSLRPPAGSSRGLRLAA